MSISKLPKWSQSWEQLNTKTKTKWSGPSDGCFPFTRILRAWTRSPGQHSLMIPHCGSPSPTAAHHSGSCRLSGPRLAGIQTGAPATRVWGCRGWPIPGGRDRCFAVKTESFLALRLSPHLSAQRTLLEPSKTYSCPSQSRVTPTPECPQGSVWRKRVTCEGWQPPLHLFCFSQPLRYSCNVAT